jgi:transcriptional regulator with PAS, ATPase and Fis domain
MSRAVLKSTWKTALVAAGATALALLLTHLADVLASRHPRSLPMLRILPWLIVLGNAAFVFWAIYRLALPLRKLVEQAQAKGIPAANATSARPTPASLKPSTDEIDQMVDICNRITQALPAFEAKQLFPEVACASHAMLQVLTVVERAAHADTTVLVYGESGTGKELIARSIHQRSERRDHPFIPINCAAIPSALLESELFGHEKGAFTGADRRRAGHFESAEGGTIFLDEIGEMPADMQAKLLRVLQERVVTPVGGSRSLPIDVRVIAATHRNLEAMMAEGTFRQDLYYRLGVLALRIPPLRERPEDIPVLVQTFLQRLGGKQTQLAPETMRCLLAHSWPGNVRELENAIEAALVMCEDTILPEHLPRRIAGDALLPLAPGMEQGIRHTDGMSLDERLAEAESRMIRQALAQSGGVQTDAAQILGIKERSLWYRIKKHGITVTSFRKGGH